jgi:hypothetical protein
MYHLMTAVYITISIERMEEGSVAQPPKGLAVSSTSGTAGARENVGDGRISVQENEREVGPSGLASQDHTYTDTVDSVAQTQF